MLPFDARTVGLLSAGLLMLIAFAAVMIRVMPTPIAIGITLWFLLSIPLGIVVGHCALGED